MCCRRGSGRDRAVKRQSRGACSPRLEEGGRAKKEEGIGDRAGKKQSKGVSSLRISRRICSRPHRLSSGAQGAYPGEAPARRKEHEELVCSVAASWKRRTPRASSQLKFFVCVASSVPMAMLESNPRFTSAAQRREERESERLQKKRKKNKASRSLVPVPPPPLCGSAGPAHARARARARTLAWRLTAPQEQREQESSQGSTEKRESTANRTSSFDGDAGPLPVLVGARQARQGDPVWHPGP